MQKPLQITFKDIDHSDAVEAKIREKVEKLERFASDMIGCHVVVEAPHKHHHKGNIYQVRIDITMPGGEIVANRRPDEHQAHQDIYVAIRDAFDHARRQLEDYVRKQHGKVKVHETLPHGIVKSLFPDQDYGIIQSADGQEVYFHRNSVIDGSFDSLAAGHHVHFNQEMGDDGLQASTVHVEGKHHVTGRSLH